MSDFHHPQPLTNEHIAILKQAKEGILREYETHDMRTFIHSCNSPSCVAGWIAYNQEQWDEDEYVPYFTPKRIANKRLGIDDEDFDLPLFFLAEDVDTPCWDGDLENEYFNTPPSSLERAQVTAKAIDRYISNTQAYFANEVKS